jgi:hypothetical protein
VFVVESEGVHHLVLNGSVSGKAVRGLVVDLLNDGKVRNSTFQFLGNLSDCRLSHVSWSKHQQKRACDRKEIKVGI